MNHPPDGIWPFRRVATYEPLALGLDRLRVESFYKSQGFFMAHVRNVEVTGTHTDEVQIRYDIDSGPRAHLMEISATSTVGPLGVEEELIRRWSDLEVDTPLTYDAFERAQDLVRAHLVSEGHAFARVSGRVDVREDTGASIVRLFVQPGPVVHFEKTTVRGLERLPESFVRNRLAYEPGDRFDPVALEQTRGRLYATGLVSSVTFDHEKTEDPERLHVIIRGSEGKRHEIQLGSGIGLQKTRYEIRGLARYRHRGFIDPLSTLSAEFRPSFGVLRATGDLTGPNIEARLTWTREDFLFPRLRSETELSYSIIQYEAYTTKGPSLTLRFSRPLLDDRLTLSLSPSLSRWSIPLGDGLRLDLEPDELRRIGIADPLTVVSLSPAVTFDGRDHPIRPRNGVYARLRLELGHVFAPPSNTYLIITPEIRGYYALASRLVLAGRLKVGSAISNLRPLPITSRYFSGGADSQRGFGRRQLAPSRPAKDGELLPVGGEALIETSLETRLFLFSYGSLGFGLVGFFDGADVADNLTDFSLPHLHWAAGGGIRIDTLVGVFRVDVGFRLNRKGPSEPDPNSPFSIHVSLGEAF